MTDKDAYTWGKGRDRQLGNGHFNHLYNPTRVEGSIANYVPIMIAAGDQHNVALFLVEPEDKTHKHRQGKPRQNGRKMTSFRGAKAARPSWELA